MIEEARILNLIPSQGLKVKLRYNSYGENTEILPFEEVKDVICLALVEETDKSTSVQPMIFDEWLDFAKSQDTMIIDLYYEKHGENL